jgi:antitoxin component YwqK of YwqJK toxin-antitoxin module
MEFIITTLQQMLLTSMAMASMELPARFLSSALAWLICFSCAHKRSPKFVNSDQVLINHKSGFIYVNDSLFTGTLFSVGSTGDTTALSPFLNGREHGTWKQFYAKGKPKEVRHFQNGRKQGEYNGWWPDGAKKFVFQFLDDEYDGTCYEWTENGDLSHEGNYVNGHEEGLQRAWYANGKIKSNYTIINGRRYGLLGTKNCKNVADSVFKR